MEKGLKKEGAAAIKGSQGTALGSGSGSSCSCNGHFAGCWAGRFLCPPAQLTSAQHSIQHSSSLLAHLP